MHANRHTLAHALRVAAEVYETDAANTANPRRVAEQFDRQAGEARRLAEDIEGATTIHLTD